MKTLSSIVLVLLGLIHFGAVTQQPTQELENRIGHDFASAKALLRALYPNLNGKNYTVTLETSDALDHARSGDDVLNIFVGEGSKERVSKELQMGAMGCVVPLQLAPPPEIPPSPPPPPPCGSSNPPKPGQFLTTGFVFAPDGHLVSFAAEGPAVGNALAQAQLARILSKRPENTDEEVASALKQVRAKFGPQDRVAFVESLHDREGLLEGLAGPLQILDISLYPPEGFGNLPPEWRVRARAKLPNGAQAVYVLDFEPFNGDLVSFHDEAIRFGGT